MGQNISIEGKLYQQKGKEFICEETGDKLDKKTIDEKLALSAMLDKGGSAAKATMQKLEKKAETKKKTTKK